MNASGRVSNRASFAILGFALAVVLLASSTPSPLYGVYQQQWHFTSTLLTVVSTLLVRPLRRCSATANLDRSPSKPDRESIWRSGFDVANSPRLVSERRRADRYRGEG